MFWPGTRSPCFLRFKNKSGRTDHVHGPRQTDDPEDDCSMSGLKAPSQPNEYIAVLPTPAGRTPLGHHFLQMFTIHNFWKVLLYLRVVPTVTASGSRGEVEMDRSPTFAWNKYVEFQDII